MSLESLRNLRRSGKKPLRVSLVTMECPRPTWLWLRDDPTIVWIPRSHDVRAHDLRALVGTEVVAMVDSLSKRRNEIAAAMDEVGATLAGIADQEVAEWCLPHPYPELAEMLLLHDRNFMWSH